MSGLMPAPRLLLTCVLLAAAPVRGEAADAPAPSADRPGGDDASRQELAALLRAADAAYDGRDDPGALDDLKARLEEAERLAPDAYDVLWRQARLYFWLSDDPALGAEKKSQLGKKSWDYGERAVKADPRRVEGQHFAAGGMGNYALGLGILAALRQGIEAKFKERLSAAEKLDPDFQRGAIQTAWGRFWFKLPWPKYDGKKSEKALLAALKKNPDNVRARVYLAELYEKEGEEKAAREQLERAAAGEPGRYDAPEERRWQKVARDLLGKR